MSTQRQDRAFTELMADEVQPVEIKESALEAAISYIGNEFDPDDVFSTKQLENWAESNGYIKE